MSKRIVFSCATPNDQGGVIPNEAIDFSRFNKNPVALKEHNWGMDPVGMWTDIKIVDGYYTGIPVFHGLTEESKNTKALYEGGWIRAASIGGDAIWEENAAGQYKLDGSGNKMCKKFILYEISIVTLPSNADAVQMDAVELRAKIYDKTELENISKSLTTLSSKYNSMTETKKPDANKPEDTKVDDKAVDPKKPGNTSTDDGHIKLSAETLPGFMEKILNGVKKFMGAPTPQNTPQSEAPSEEPINQDQPKPIGLKSKAAKAKAEMEAAHEAAEKAVKKATEAKAKADAEDASEEMKAEAARCKKDAEDAMAAYDAACEKYSKAKDDDEDEDDDDGKDAKPDKEKTKNSSTKKEPMKPVKKTKEELAADMTKLAPKPENLQAKIVNLSRGVTLTKLAASKGDSEENKILMRVMSRDAGEKSISDYAVVLNAIINDPRYSAFKDKARIIMNVPEGALDGYRRNPATRIGLNLEELSAELSAGRIEMWDRHSGTMRPMTKLSSSDDALAAPALNAIEWLPLAIFKLFPSNGWKNDIPIFGAQMTGNNTGIIWANITADPAIYKGTQPVNPSDYTYNDDAVSLSLTPYWLQPMRWTPLSMHQLRYDMMGTGWAQAFAKMGAVIDDNLIYTFAALVPAASVVLSSGLSGYQTNPQVFNIANSSSPDAFYWSPSFTGGLLAPTLNDIIRIEQIFRKQNFELESTKVNLVMDPTTEAKLASDPEAKSLLTRWLNDSGAEFKAFKHTIFNERSRVAVYDQATSQVKDINGVIPATSVGANLAFIASQLGIGLGMLDVFMVQDPTNYGYKMSSDIRIGGAGLRNNGDGLGLFTYGSANV